jgi:hypothetical protein
MPQYTKTYLTKEATKFGAEVEVNESGGSVSVTVDAPDGKVWRSSGTHAISASCLKGPDGPTEESVKDLLERMAMGLDDCPNEDCEDCYDQGEEGDDEDDQEGAEDLDGQQQVLALPVPDQAYQVAGHRDGPPLRASTGWSRAIRQAG